MKELAEVFRVAFGGSARGIADVILRLRDVLNIPFKFKPWGALKFAKFLKVLAWLGPIIEALPTVMDMIQKRKLDKAVADLKEVLNQVLGELFTRNEFERQACPGLAEMQRISEEEKSKLRKVEDMLRISGETNQEFLTLR